LGRPEEEQHKSEKIFLFGSWRSAAANKLMALRHNTNRANLIKEYKLVSASFYIVTCIIYVQAVFID
jgi:hypothetical protein